MKHKLSYSLFSVFGPVSAWQFVCLSISFRCAPYNYFEKLMEEKRKFDSKMEKQRTRDRDSKIER